MGYTVMIVDDSATIRDVLARTLEMTRLPLHEVIGAENGQDALVKMSERWVDIVFTDLHMPIMDGMGMIDAMKQSPGLRDIPVVVVSTEGSSTRIDELREKGISGYLRKPFTPESIRDVLTSILGEWHG